MSIRDFDGNHKALTDDDVNAVLSSRRRVDNAMVNSFWLSYETGFPCMSIMVRDDLATVWYAPQESHAGYVSATNLNMLQRGATTSFYFDKDRQDVSNDVIIKWEDALETAKQFFRSSDLPNTIRWIEL
jgi:hypothetical protein